MAQVHRRVALVGIGVELLGGVVVFLLPAANFGARCLHVMFYGFGGAGVLAVLLLTVVPVLGYLEGRRSSRHQSNESGTK